MSNYHWENPVRTGTNEIGPTLAERTITPDPAAVERLRRMMVAQQAARPQLTAAEIRRQSGQHIVANLIRRRAELDALKLPNEERLRELYQEHLAGKRPAALAKEVGITYQRLCREWRALGLEVVPPAAGQRERGGDER